jgi:hypothetical protein
MQPTIIKHKTAEELRALLPDYIEVIRTFDLGDHHEITLRAPTHDMALRALRDATRKLNPTQVWVGARLSGFQKQHWTGGYIITDQRPPLVSPTLV